MKYTAPNHIDPKLLDPEHVFKEVSLSSTLVSISPFFFLPFSLSIYICELSFFQDGPKDKKVEGHQTFV